MCLQRGVVPVLLPLPVMQLKVALRQGGLLPSQRGRQLRQLVAQAFQASQALRLHPLRHRQQLQQPCRLGCEQAADSGLQRPATGHRRRAVAEGVQAQLPVAQLQDHLRGSSARQLASVHQAALQQSGGGTCWQQPAVVEVALGSELQVLSLQRLLRMVVPSPALAVASQRVQCLLLSMQLQQRHQRVARSLQLPKRRSRSG